MITLQDLRNVISYGEHTVMLILDEKHDMHCSFVEITDEILRAEHFYICKEPFFPNVYQLLFSTLLKELKPAKGITDDNYETLKIMKEAKIGLIIYWEVGKIKKFLLQL